MKDRWKAYVYIPVLACLLAAGSMYVLRDRTGSREPSGEQIYDLDEYFSQEKPKLTEAQVVDDKNVLPDVQGTNKQPQDLQLLQDEQLQGNRLQGERFQNGQLQNGQLQNEQLQGRDALEAEFVLRAMDGQVVVYRSRNQQEGYMTTGILVQELPADTQQEILEGKEIADEKALYFFLESHSS